MRRTVTAVLRAGLALLLCGACADNAPAKKSDVREELAPRADQTKPMPPPPPKPPSFESTWRLEGLEAPESAIFDPLLGQIYVSNVNGQPTGKDGNGFLSRVGTDGTLIELEWVKGLNAPKGLEILNDRLFVADIDRLVEVSVSEGKVTHEFPAKGATFLNDVTIDKDGNVYVSDMLGNKLYRLHGDTFEVWLESEALESPNGLFAEDGRLIIACWGKMTEGWNTKVPGHLKTISLVDKTVRSLGRGTPVGNLDGIEPDGSGNYFVSDYTAGKVFHVKPSGEAVPLLAVGPGSADIEFIPEKKLLLVPMMNDGALAAYTLEGTK